MSSKCHASRIISKPHLDGGLLNLGSGLDIQPVARATIQGVAKTFRKEPP